MRIVALANFYGPTSGGLRTFLDQTGRRYQAAGHQRILVIPGPSDRDSDTAAGRRVVVRSPRLPGRSGYHLLVNRIRVLRLLAELRPDSLEVSDKLTLSWLARWAAAQRIPVVLCSHERLDAVLAPRLPGWVPLEVAADQVNRQLVRLADTVVCASRFAAAEFERVGALDVRRVPLGVDLAVFRPPEQPRPGVGCGRLLVTVGRLSREKRPELAVDCLRALLADEVPARLLMVGDGPLRGELERRAAGLPVRFLGHVPDRASVAHLLGAADVLVAPGPAETFGLAVLESLACGTPVVVPDRGAAAELVGGPGSGVVTDGTAAGLAGGVRRVLAVPPAIRQAAARSRAERFDWQATVAELVDVHAGLLAARQAQLVDATWVFAGVSRPRVGG
jgi:alpha-1,6-mannosyltransferase